MSRDVCGRETTGEELDVCRQEKLSRMPEVPTGAKRVVLEHGLIHQDTGAASGWTEDDELSRGPGWV